MVKPYYFQIKGSQCVLDIMLNTMDHRTSGSELSISETVKATFFKTLLVLLVYDLNERKTT